MIVFDLRCAGGHVFEAWFASTGAWEEQRAGGQVRCPLCDTADVGKAVMAPNVASKANSRAGAGDRSEPPGDPERMKAALQAVAAVQAKVLEGSSWVGGAFAARARAMHDGEEARAPIHGQATLAEAKALAEDGVPIAPLPLPVAPPEQVN